MPKVITKNPRAHVVSHEEPLWCLRRDHGVPVNFAFEGASRDKEVGHVPSRRHFSHHH